MDEDSLLCELKESLKHCRERIRKQMKNDNFVVTNVTWDLIWAEMKHSRKVSSRVKKQLKRWFQLWKEFPTERSREEDPNSLHTSQTTDDLYIVQPGDLWMDCSSPQQSETVARTRESSVMSIDSFVQSKPAHVQGEGVTFDEKRESSASSISDIPGLDVHKTPGDSVVIEFDDFPLPRTKPWWISIPESPVQSSQLDAPSPLCASSKEEISDERGRESYQTKRNKCEKEQNSLSSSSNKRLPETESSYFVHRSKAAGDKKINERSGQGREIDPLKQQDSSRRLRKSTHIRKREPRIRSSQNTNPKTQTKLELLPSNMASKPFAFPPKDYKYEKGDWVVHAIMSSCSTPEDLKVALRERGYELKHIIKRDCTLPQKWICSLIASADRTHIITSENIWLKGWEVEFVCDEEDIFPFLAK